MASLRNSNARSFVFLLASLILSCFCLQISISSPTDTIKQGQLINNSESIISTGGIFELGFFSPGNSSNFYVGIWYKKIPVKTFVWVAHGDHLLTGSPGDSLTIDNQGNLVILDGRGISITLTSIVSTGNNTATLLDSGNLVLRDVENSNILWQSFDSPSDTLLPGMKLGLNRKTGQTWSLTSWRSLEDPGPGVFTLKLDPENDLQFNIMQGSRKYWTSGEWNGKMFSFVPETKFYSIYNFSFVRNENESYFTYTVYNKSMISRAVMDSSGQIRQYTWLEGIQQWNIIWSQQQCEVYAFCGAFSSCNQKALPFCRCLQGFKPRFPGDWGLSDWSGGCVRKTFLQCGNTTSVHGEKDAFLLMPNMRFPVNAKTLAIGSAEECELACLNDCSCNSYAYLSGRCSIWDGDLLNLQQLSDGDTGGGDLYLRLSASELPNSKGKKRWLWVIATIPIALAILISGCFMCCLRRRKLKRKGEKETSQNLLLFDLDISIKTTKHELSDLNKLGKGGKKDVELPLFSFASVSAATDNFSATNLLGEGGFGPVYKGKVLVGHEVAVKRLSRRSGQGLEELRNEATLIAKLQHRNLVRLLGCCIEGEEKILIYEYMPNKSLDHFLFDPFKQGLLDWRRRVHIIEGIAQGLLYLHQYSRLRIIHRDLKASNILLDRDMNPKISDFGMARIFGGNKSREITMRIVGTYGYMSPEYAMKGQFSVKSDVFSFGVLLLEILSGKKNTGFYLSDSVNLIGHAWKLWKSNRGLELMDPILGDPSSISISLRYIHVALLCVQEYAIDRPNMSDVVSMLSNELAFLPSPKQPAFSIARSVMAENSSMNMATISSVNDVTISMMQAR